MTTAMMPAISHQTSPAARSASPPLILLHGAGVSNTWWSPQIAALRDAFAIHAPDLPGHGIRADQPFTLDAAVDRVQETVAAAGGGPAILAGISLGGYVAMAHAARYPQQSAGLLLAGCSLNLNGLNGLGFKATYLFLRYKGVATIEAGSRRAMEKRIAPDLLAPVLAGGLYFETAIEVFRRIAGKNYARMLHGYPHPILFVNGVDDEPNCKGEAKMLSALPQARVQHIAGADHLTNLQQPEAFNEILKNFAVTIAAHQT